MTMPLTPLITNELALLETLVPLAGSRLIEAGCGAAHLARSLVSQHESTEVVGIEVDDRQLGPVNATEVPQRREPR